MDIVWKRMVIVLLSLLTFFNACLTVCRWPAAIDEDGVIVVLVHHSSQFG